MPLFFSEFFISYYIHAKWIFFYYVTVVLMISLKGKVCFPQLKRTEYFLLIFLVLSILIHILAYGYMDNEPALLKASLFIVNVIIFYNFLLVHKLRTLTILIPPILLSSFIVAMTAYVQIIGLSLEGYLPKGGTPISSFFGHQNPTSQYISIGMLFGLFYLSKLVGFQRILVSLLIGMLFATILYLRSRAVLLGVFLSFCYMIFFYRKIPRKNLLIITLSASFFLWIPLMFTETSEPIANILKRGTGSNFRLEIWRDSIDLIRSHPLGVGDGHFRFAHIPSSLKYGGQVLYKETILWNHNHNEFLQMLAENGILYFIALWGFILAVYLACLKNFKKLHQGQKWQLHLFHAVGITIGTHAMFSWPFLVPTSFFILAMLLAILLNLIKKPRVFLFYKPLYRRIFFSVFVLWILSIAGRRTYAEYILKNRSSSVQNVQLACNLYPRRWENCLRTAHYSIQQHEFDKGQKYLKKLLHISPFHTPAIKMQAFLEAKKKHRFGECLHLWIFDLIYQQRSSVHSIVRKQCPPALLEDFKQLPPNQAYGKIIEIVFGNQIRR